MEERLITCLLNPLAPYYRMKDLQFGWKRMIIITPRVGAILPRRRNFKLRQAELINQGKFREAMQMDIDDIRSQFGNKYDTHIQQMLDYYDTIPAWKLDLGSKMRRNLYE